MAGKAEPIRPHEDPNDPIQERISKDYEWGFVTDAVTLRIPRPDASPGGEHRVELDLGLSIPYLIVGPGEGQPLLASSHTDKTVACA